MGCHSICLAKHTCLMTLIIELLFGTSLLLPCYLRLLLLHPSSHPLLRYCCDIFLFSIPEVIWLVKLHLFPQYPPTHLLGVFLFDFLSGWLQSLLPCPWSTTLGQHRLQSIVMEMTQHLSPWKQPLNSGRPHPTLRTQESHRCLYIHIKTHMHPDTKQRLCIGICGDIIGCFHCLVFLWAATSLWEVWKSSESKITEFK